MVYLSADLNTDPDLRCHYKRRENLIFVGSSEHPAARQGGITVDELLTYDFVVTERSGICYGRLQKLAAQHDAMLHASIEVDSTVAIAALLQKNIALAFLPKYSVDRLLEEKRLVQIEVDLEPQVYYSQILCHKNRWISPFMEWLIEEIKLAFPDCE